MADCVPEGGNYLAWLLVVYVDDEEDNLPPKRGEGEFYDFTT